MADRLAKPVRPFAFDAGGAATRARFGGKGAGLVDMTRAGLPVPPGFIIGTEVCRDYLSTNQLPATLADALRRAIKKLERSAGKTFGGPANPLLVAVRSGAAVSMPGMMETVLNVGLNDAVAAAIADSGRERFAYDSYRRLIAMFASAVDGVPGDAFAEALAAARISAGVDDDRELDDPAMRGVAAASLAIYQKHVGRPFPQDPHEQLLRATEAVFKSWSAERALRYRQINDIANDSGTAVVVQAMVFGNSGVDSATGVGFTRNPSTGQKKFFGEFLVQAQGEDLVAGTHTPLNCKEWFPKWNRPLWRELRSLAAALEARYADVQDFEFTVERGTLYLLQTRTAQRTTAAAVKIAVDLANEGVIDRPAAVARVNPTALAAQQPRVPDKRRSGPPLTHGLPASPGVASGRLAFTAAAAERRAMAGEAVLLVRPETFPDDIGGFHAAVGVLTSTGGMTSHAAVVARGMNRVCVVGAGALKIDEAAERLTIKVGRRFHAFGPGDVLSIDGTTGAVYAGEVPTVIAPPSGPLRTLLKWKAELD